MKFASVRLVTLDVLASPGHEAVVVRGPTVMPWGDRPPLPRDPDGSLVEAGSQRPGAPASPER